MKIAIVEDNSSLRKLLKYNINKLPYKTEIIFESTNVLDSIKKFNENNIDLAIVDVEIEGGLIFDVLKSLKTINFEVLFLSAHGSYAINAFEYNALNYLLKPLVYDQLKKQIDYFLKRINYSFSNDFLKNQILNLEKTIHSKKLEKIALPAVDGISYYRFNDITSVKADANYCHFFLKNGTKVTVSKPLKEFQNILEENGFYRVHKSSIINLSYVEKYVKGDGGLVILEDKSEFFVSRRKKEGLLEALQKM